MTYKGLFLVSASYGLTAGISPWRRHRQKVCGQASEGQLWGGWRDLGMNRLRKVPEQHCSLGGGMGTRGRSLKQVGPARVQRQRPPFPRREPVAQLDFSSLLGLPSFLVPLLA